MDHWFLREAQARGWEIEAVTATECVVKCPAQGCGVRMKLRPKGPIPARVADGWQPGVVIESYQDALTLLTLKRKQLRLSIEELEGAAGLATDHIAKFENLPRSSKIPNVETFIVWMQTLGFSMVLRTSSLPDQTLREIAGTRHREPSRRRRFAKPVRTLAGPKLITKGETL